MHKWYLNVISKLKVVIPRVRRRNAYQYVSNIEGGQIIPTGIVVYRIAMLLLASFDS